MHGLTASSTSSRSAAAARARRGEAGRLAGARVAGGRVAEDGGQQAAARARPRAAARAGRSSRDLRERRGGGLDRALDVLGRVGERREPGLELRRRRVDAAGEQAAAPGGVGVEVAGLRAGVVAHRLGAEEDGQQAGRGRDPHGLEPAARAAPASPSASASVVAASWA